MTHVNMRRGFGVIRLVLAGAAMTAADLVLPCEPGFIITGAAGVQDPLAETLAHRGKIMASQPDSLIGKKWCPRPDSNGHYLAAT